MRQELTRLRDLLVRLDHPRAAEISTLLLLWDQDPDSCRKRLNGNDWWAGAGSLAAETLAPNPGMRSDLWEAEIREFRELLIAVGEDLMARGNENPGISSWVLAFRNWSANAV